MDLVHAIYVATQTFPQSERFALSDQMRRAAISVVSNIAEGFGRFSRNECRKHLRIARGSLYELETQILVASRLAYIDETAVKSLQDRLARTGKPLQGLIRYVDELS